MVYRSSCDELIVAKVQTVQQDGNGDIIRTFIEPAREAVST